MMKMSVFLRVLCVATPLVMAVAGMRSLILADWWLENLVVMVFFLVLALTHRRLPLSNSAYLLLFAFLCLHEYGAAYSYSNVPFGDALMPWLGGSRNHYDRLIHFLFGLMLAVPVYEAMSMITRQRGAVAHLFTVQFVLAASALYEVLEWAVAVNVAPELGVEFIGAQGDPWDSPKDIALAFAGSVITTSAASVFRFSRKGQ